MNSEPKPSRPTAPRSDGALVRSLAAGGDDLLTAEEPLLIDVDGRTLLTMRTPGRDRDLAVGFLLSEGIVPRVLDIADVDLLPADPARGEPDRVRLELRRSATGLRRERLARVHEIRTSCGVCGAGDVDALLDELPILLPGVPELPRAHIGRLVATLQAHQPLFARTGGCHGALLATTAGDVVGAGEDVGRHNALDKAIGQAAGAGVDFTRLCAVLSGRAGYDLVVKCLRLRVPIVISVSAPSSLAFDLCHAAGATLIGFARGDDCRVYTGSQRLLA